MTVFALGRSRLVDNHRLAGHFACQFVTVQARHIDVRTIERIPRLFVVIKLRWLPTRVIVATRAVRGIRPAGKLIVMRILMAPGAHLWGG